jgi:hypothetical protein
VSVVTLFRLVVSNEFEVKENLVTGLGQSSRV